MGATGPHFQPLAAPFDDFVLRIAERERPADPGLAAFLAGQPFGLAERSAPAPQLRLFSRRGGFSGDGVFVSGFGNLDARFLPDGAAVGRAVAGLGPEAAQTPRLRGQFTVVDASGDRPRVFSDWMGVASLFICAADDATYVSNRADVLARLLARLAPERARLDRTSLALLLIVDGNFARSLTGERTLVEGVGWLAPDVVLEIQADGAVVRRGRARLHEIVPDPEAYAWGLDQAALQIMENVAAALDHPGFDHRVLMLSGGYDSRLVLAAAAALGRLEALEVCTRLEADPRDIDIAGGLARRMGLTPVNIAAHNPLPHSLGMARHTSVKFGANHTVGAQNDTVTDMAGTRMVRLVGGGGETYRALPSKGLTALVGGHDPAMPLETLLDRAFARFAADGPASAEALALARAAHQEVLSAMPGSDAVTRVDITQFYYKGRAFFGEHALLAFLHHPYVVMPLFAPAAVMASLAADPVRRASGGVMFDLLDRLCPELARSPSTNGPWPPAAVTGAPDAAALSGPPPALPPGRELMLRAPAITPDGRPPRPPGPPRPPLDSWLREALPGLYEAALDCPEFAGLVRRDRLDARIAWMVERNGRFVSLWASRLHALAHVRAVVG